MFYKATYNLKCLGFQYEVGKTYILNSKIETCVSGFHYCEDPDNVLKYYDCNKNFVLLEIEPLGKIIHSSDKCVTDKIKIIRVIPLTEYNSIFKKHKFDKNYNLIYKECSPGNWYRQCFSESGKLISFENSKGYKFNAR